MRAGSFNVQWGKICSDKWMLTLYPKINKCWCSTVITQPVLDLKPQSTCIKLICSGNSIHHVHTCTPLITWGVIIKLY